MKKKAVKVNKGRKKPQGIIKQTTKVSCLKTTLFLKSRGDTKLLLQSVTSLQLRLKGRFLKLGSRPGLRSGSKNSQSSVHPLEKTLRSRCDDGSWR